MINRKQYLFNILSFILFYLFCLPLTHASIKKITVCHDHYPPSEMHLSSNNNQRGFATDIIADIYSKLGYQVNFFPATYVRAVKMTQEGECDIIAQIIPNSEVDILYPTALVLNYKVAFFVRNKSNWVYNGVESLKGQRLINIIGFDYSDYPPLENFVNNPKNNIYTLYGDSAIERAIKMIAYDRADTISLNTMVAKYYINQLGLTGKIKAAPVGNPELIKILNTGLPLSPGFSPKNKNVNKLIKIWDEERPKLNKNINTYLSKYGVSE